MKNSDYGNLRRRIVLILLIVLTPPLLGAFFFGYRVRTLLVEETRRQAERIAWEVAQDHEERITQAREIMLTLASLPQIREGSTSEASAVLAAAAALHTGYTHFGLVDPRGRLIVTDGNYTGESVDFSDREWFQRLRDTRQFTHGTIVRGKLTNRRVLPLAHPIVGGNGEVRRVLVVGLKTGWVRSYLGDNLLPKGSSLSFVVSKGGVVTLLEDASEQMMSFPSDRSLALTVKVVERLEASLTERRPEAFLGINGKDETRLFAAAPLRLIPGSLNRHSEEAYILASLPAAPALAEADRALILLVLWLTASLLVGTVAVRFSGDRWALRPLVQLVAVSKRSAGGNRGRRIDVRSEPGELERNLDILASQIESRETQLERELYWSELLSVISEAMAKRQSIESILRVVVQRLVEGFDAIAGGMTIRDRATGNETFKVTHAASKEVSRDLRKYQESETAVTTEEIAETFEQNLPNVRALEEMDVRFLPEGFLDAFIEQQENLGVQASLLLPVFAEETHLGSLWMLLDDGRELDSYEESFLKRLGAHLSVAIQQNEAYAELQRSYEELQRTLEAAKQKERLNAMGQMASGIAHDINNSLMPISGYTSLLLENETGLSAEARAQLETIRLAATNIKDATSRMRKFYRKTENEEYTWMRVADLFESVLNLSRPRWEDMPEMQGNSVEVSVELGPGVADLWAAESEVTEALTNLLFNAVDAMPQGGTLTLSARREENYVVLEVRDTGVGMSEEQRRRALEPFYTTKGDRGTGMGLGMVYGTMQRHGGEIEIESDKWRGTTVRLLFPTGQGWAVTESEASDSTPPRSLRLLCVDDDPGILEVMEDLLRSGGHEITTASEGTQAIQMVSTALEEGEPFDAVITDLGMPHVDGRELIEELRQIAPKTPVLLLSGWEPHLNTDDPVHSLADASIGKPPRRGEIERVLHTVITSEERGVDHGGK